MVQLSIATNFPVVQRNLDRLKNDLAAKVLSTAVNRTLAQAQTEMSKQIRSEFNLSAAKVREKLFVKRAAFKAGRFTLEGVLESRDRSGKRRAINLINFAARETARGLTVKIKKGGGRVLATRRGFIGNKGRTTFARVDRKRLPIKPLQTIDVPQMFNTRKIKTAVLKKIRERFPVIFERELKFYLGRAGA